MNKTIHHACALLLVVASVLAAPAAATNHFVQIEEVMAGAFGRDEIQFVEIRMSDCSQNLWGPENFGGPPARARLVFFNASNQEIGEFLFPNNPPCNSRSALIATQAFADLPGVPTPDFIMPPLANPGSGKVCWKDNPDSAEAFDVTICLSYGSFTGDTEEASGTNAPALPTLDICTLKRTEFLNAFGQLNNNGDFDVQSPAPKNAAGTSATVGVPPRFGDVGSAHPFFLFIEGLANAEVTAGCGGGNYCPGDSVTRAQMAVFLLKASEGKSFTPPACVTPTFSDVPCSSPFSPWINELAARAITSGCGAGKYCPTDPVTRAQMAVFLLKTLEGSGFTPPACVTPTFNDVPCSSPFAPWINELAARGITGGCGGGNYCPGDAVTRGQMAVFLSKTFDLPLPVDPASTVCPEPDAQACSHDICVEGGPLIEGCDPCVTQICAVDSFCCTTSWDSICVGRVSSVCGQSCP